MKAKGIHPDFLHPRGFLLTHKQLAIDWNQIIEQVVKTNVCANLCICKSILHGTFITHHKGLMRLVMLFKQNLEENGDIASLVRESLMFSSLSSSIPPSFPLSCLCYMCVSLVEGRYQT